MPNKLYIDRTNESLMYTSISILRNMEFDIEKNPAHTDLTDISNLRDMAFKSSYLAGRGADSPGALGSVRVFTIVVRVVR